MLKRILIFAVMGLILLSLPSSALAQSYYFRVDQEVVHVYWNADGSMSLDYLFVFSNQPGASAIDFVDLGLPNNNYDFSSITAERDGRPLGVERDYQGSGCCGVAIALGGNAIQPGETGRVHVYVGRVEKVLYPDDNDEAYASAVFMNTYFGSQFVTGTTDLTVVFHLPPDILSEEPRYHYPSSNWPSGSEPETGRDAAGRVTYTWHAGSARASEGYTFGASFPAQYVPEDAVVQPSAFSGFQINFDSLISIACCGFFAFMFVGMPVISVFNDRRRKLQYMAPKVSIEGHGIKRGLTAVEAAILMETPLDKVMTMILFGVIKKGAAEVTSRDPLEVKVIQPLPEGLHGYEKQFLEAFNEPNIARRRESLKDMTVALIRSVADKMKGFSRRETIEYYKNIMERAWAQIENAGTPEMKSEMYEQAMEWTMLDKEYDDRTRRVFTGPVFVPTWWGRYDPTYRPVSTGGGGLKTAAPAPSGRPSLPSVPGSSFAASLVTGIQNFSSKVIGDVSGFTGRVTNVTNPPPKPSSSGVRSSGGRSGGGCACACACAGCACACAGGGR